MHIRVPRVLPLAASALAVSMLAAACGSSTSGESSSAAESAPESAAASAAASTEPSAAASTATVEAPAELRIAYQPFPSGDLVVKGSGWLEEALPNTTITWTKFESGGDVNTAFIAGAIDIGLAGSSPVVRGLSAPNNIPYSVAWIFDVIGEAESLVAHPDSGITDVAGLKGKKIATPFASTAHYSLLAALAEGGLSESDVTIIDLEPPDILAAWTRGDIDATYVWNPTLAELKAGGATVLTTSAVLADKGYPTFDLGVVANSLREQHPQVVQEWLRAQQRAVELIQNDPAAAAEIIAPQLGITAEEVQAQLAGNVFIGQEVQQTKPFFGTTAEPGDFGPGLLGAADFQLAQGKIDAVPTLEHIQASIDTEDLGAAFAG